MVELVDSVDLGSTAKSVQVRVLLPAPRQAAIFASKSPPALFSSLFPFHYSLFSPRIVPRRCVVEAGHAAAPTRNNQLRPAHHPVRRCRTTFPQGKASLKSMGPVAQSQWLPCVGGALTQKDPPPLRREFFYFPFLFSFRSSLFSKKTGPCGEFRMGRSCCVGY